MKRLLIIFLILLGCTSKKETEFVNNFDPYLESFWGKGIKYLTIGNPCCKNDTLWFDDDGNIIQIKSYGSFERMSFDRNHFLIRQLYKGDMVANYLVDYHRAGDCLVQNWRELEHDKWELSPTDTSAHVYRFEKMYFNNGKIFRTVMSDSSLVTDYFYSNEKIIKKEEHSLRDPSDVSIWNYSYSSNGSELSKIEFIDNDSTHFDFYFQNGLPQFIQYKDHRNYKLTYDYHYGEATGNINR